jgi:hypothetical protein
MDTGMSALDVGNMGRLKGHRREIFSCAVIWPVLLGNVVLNVVVTRSRGGSRGAPLRDVYYQGFFNRLPSWKVFVEGSADFFLWTQDAFIAEQVGCGIAAQDLENDVWRVDCPTQRVCVLLQDGISNVINQIF